MATLLKVYLKLLKLTEEYDSIVSLKLNLSKVLDKIPSLEKNRYQIYYQMLLKLKLIIIKHAVCVYTIS